MNEKLDKPLISVVVILYNTAKYLDQCISSIVNQTYKNLEIILVDDGSTDDSPKICDEWAKKDNRVKVIHQENRGVGYARNTGLDAVTGELIGIVDSDDYLAPDMYEKLYNLMIENDADVSWCRYSRVIDGQVQEEPDEHKPVRIITGKEALVAWTKMTQEDYLEGFVLLWNKLYKAKLFDDVRFPKVMYDDVTRIHRLMGNCNRIAITYEHLYYYRVHEGSVSVHLPSWQTDHEKYIKFWHNMLDARRDLCECLDEKDMKELSEYIRQVSCNYAFMVYMLEKINYFQYRQDIKRFMGFTPLQLAANLIRSGKLGFMLRGVKIILLWLKSMFNPKIDYIPWSVGSDI